MPRLLRFAALLLLAVAPTACSVDCTDYTNTTVATGTVRDAADTQLGIANLGLYENVQAGGEGHLLFTLDGPFGSGGAPLAGHVLSGRLLGPSGALILELDPKVPSPVMHGVINNYAPLSRDALRELHDQMLTGRVRMVIETDLPGREHIETLLSGTQYLPYVKRSCPYT